MSPKMFDSAVEELVSKPIEGSITNSKDLKQFLEPYLKGVVSISSRKDSYYSAVVLVDREWDTKFFEIKTGFIDAYSKDTPCNHNDMVENLTYQIGNCRRKEFKLVISRLSLARPDLIRVFEEVGFQSYDFGVQLELLSHPSQKHFSKDIEIGYSDESDVWSLMSLAGSVFHHGHFHEDERISEDAVNAMNALWIRNLFYNGDASVIVARHRSEIVGFCTLRSQKTGTFLKRVIDLVGVSQKYTGQGIGAQLLCWIFNSIQEGSLIGVGTQLSNTPALNLYMKNGFQPVRFYSTMHRWINHNH